LNYYQNIFSKILHKQIKKKYHTMLVGREFVLASKYREETGGVRLTLELGAQVLVGNGMSVLG
jgi:F0F1-type ATP synthase assembly protein I